MVSPSRRALADELDRYDRLLEIGVGNRLGVARALAERGRDVVAVDIDSTVESSLTESDGTLLIHRADVTALAAADNPLAMLDDPSATESVASGGFDVVYGLNLPAELQRPTVSLANGLDANCLFTTLGFEQPIVPAERRSVGETTVHVARGPCPGN